MADTEQTTPTQEGSEESVLSSVVERQQEQIPFEILEDERMSGSRVRFKIQLAEETLAPKLSETLKEFSRHVRLPGFRPGKAPVKLIRRRYENDAREEALKRMVPRLTDILCEQKEVKRVADPVLLDWKSSEEKGSTVELAFEIVPDIPISEETLSDLKGEVYKIRTDEKYLENALEDLRAKNATFESQEGATFEKGDALVFDCEVSDPDGNLIPDRCATAYYSTNVQEDLPDDVVEALTGKGIGDTVELDVTEPSEYAPGQEETVHYKISIIEVKKRVLPELDDDFAMDVDERFETLDDLKNFIREDLERREEKRLHSESVNKALSVLRERLEFDIPQSMVEQLTRQQMSRTQRRLASEGLSLQDLSQDLFMNYYNMLQNQSTLMVINGLIVGKLADYWDVKPTEEDIQEALERTAKEEGRKPLAVRASLEKEKQFDQFVDDLRIYKAEQKLVEAADLEYKEVSVEEYQKIQKEQEQKIREEEAKIQEDMMEEAEEKAEEASVETELEEKPEGSNE